jgi:hypothetical protein
MNFMQATACTKLRKRWRLAMVKGVQNWVHAGAH